jgi:predicted Zn-dependent peptidase
VAIVSYTPTERTFEAIDMALAVLARLQQNGVDETMLASARNYILGQFPTALETAAQLGRQLAALEAFGLDIAYINAYGQALTATDVASVGEVIEAVYPLPDDLVFVLLGDAATLREGAAAYGPVVEMPITESRFRPPAGDAE